MPHVALINFYFVITSYFRLLCIFASFKNVLVISIHLRMDILTILNYDNFMEKKLIEKIYRRLKSVFLVCQMHIGQVLITIIAQKISN